jgi:PKD repeat protein
MIFGPDGPTQSLYYTTYANGGQVRRIAFTAQNQAPMAVLSADITSGTAPLTVSFDGSGSSDPDLGDTLTYRWDFGDGSTPIETTNATATHEYSTAGTFAATLSVRDNQGATSAAATLQIMVSNPPVDSSERDIAEGGGDPQGRPDADRKQRHLDRLRTTRIHRPVAALLHDRRFMRSDPRGDGIDVHPRASRLRVDDPRSSDSDESCGRRLRDLGADRASEARLLRNAVHQLVLERNAPSTSERAS